MPPAATAAATPNAMETSPAPPPRTPASAIAARLAAAIRAAPATPLAYLAIDERRADAIGAALRQFAPEVEVLVYPPWDTLPYDRAPPSRESQGRRIAARARLATRVASGRAWISCPEAMLQRAPAIQGAHQTRLALAPGSGASAADLAAFARAAGYVVHDPVEEPGEVSSLAEVIDVWPGDAEAPVRCAFVEGALRELHDVDVSTLRSSVPIARVELHAVDESAFELEDPFDAFHAWRMSGDSGVASRVREVLDQVREAYEARLALCAAEDRPAPPATRHLDADESVAAFGRPIALDRLEAIEPVPVFARMKNPGRAFCDYVQARLKDGRRVVIGGLARELRAMSRALQRGCALEVRAADGWAAALATSTGEVASVVLDAEGGFDDAANGVTLIAGPDVLGGHLTRRTGGTAALADAAELALGDVVIHEDHGLGVLRALERVEVDGREQDAVRLEYHGDATLLVGVEAFDRLWRYGSDPSGVALDRLHTDAWNHRRVEISREIDRTAAHLVEVARERASARGVVLEPPKAAYARFAVRFGYPETPDQAAAVAAVQADLASGRAMDRLVCGDVGFGKTEVALRAAAIAAIAGRQVAVVAPTTVLARQHVETFTRRFAGTGVEVGKLSRLTTAAEARRVKAGLADGSIGIVVGTHAIAAQDVAFADLALLIIDEEQRFGARIKATLHALAPGAHRLTLTATPIPRTLQLAMIGVQDVSVIATPPSRRRPIRTFVAQLDEANVRTALLREHRRGGQSFVVAPRIEDLETLRERLKTIAPELTVRVAHGELSAEDVDAAMVDFASGDGDILLATSIIESGLDVPRANTMIVWRPDRFGLAQLHQLRGRVGRGRTQGVAYLLTDGETPLSDATAARLATLQALERLGAGLAISARDLDLRGAGDLVGEEQAGHLQLIGADLYQSLLTRAVRAAKGEPVDDWKPELGLQAGGALPVAYVPDATMRLNLYARASRLRDVDEVASFEAELEDRFGSPPEEVMALLAAARLRAFARLAGVVRIDAGPRAVAFSFNAASIAAIDAPDGARWKDARLIWPLSATGAAQAAAIEAQLRRWTEAATSVAA